MCAFNVRKKDINELIYKVETDSQTQGHLVVASMEVRWERDELGFGTSRYKVLKNGYTRSYLQHRKLYSIFYG